MSMMNKTIHQTRVGYVSVRFGFGLLCIRIKNDTDLKDSPSHWGLSSPIKKYLIIHFLRYTYSYFCRKFIVIFLF